MPTLGIGEAPEKILLVKSEGLRAHRAPRPRLQYRSTARRCLAAGRNFIEKPENNRFCRLFVAK